MDFYGELREQLLYKKIVDIKDVPNKRRYDDSDIVQLTLNDGTILHCKTNAG